VAVGDTLKFGRVRYKIVVINNSRKGTIRYDANDRFSRKSTRIGGNRPELLTENDNANISFGSSNSSGRLEIDLQPPSAQTRSRNAGGQSLKTATELPQDMDSSRSLIQDRKQTSCLEG
jgi:hypothetical protein